MSDDGFSFVAIKTVDNSFARRGIIHTPSGDIDTPAFSPVGTKATVRSLDSDDLKSVDSQVVLTNTYHLYLRPGINTIREFAGISDFMNWTGPLITDSGGYQVSFLWSPESKDHSEKVKITDEGAEFTSHIDGSKHFLTPEKSMQIQQVIGADIIMAFDQPMSSDFSEKHNQEAYQRSLDWEKRSHSEWKRLGMKNLRGNYQALFGIIHGMEDPTKTQDFFRYLLELDFPGYAIGDESIGSDPKAVAETLDAIKDMIPQDRPLHALGLGGGPEGVFTAVERGVDIFDNTSITRMARTGLLFIYPEDGGSVNNKFRMNIKKAKYKNKKTSFSEICRCEACADYSSAYLHHLFKSNELLGLRLATIHNITFINDLMRRIRKSIEEGSFGQLKKQWLDAV